MRPWDVLGIAYAQIRGNPLRSFFTLLGIIVSVAFLIAVVAIIQGMNAYVSENLAGALIGLYLFPLGFGAAGVFGGCFAEDVRMAADQLLGDGVDHVADIEEAAF